jgi:hypothetical protein
MDCSGPLHYPPPTAEPGQCAWNLGHGDADLGTECGNVFWIPVTPVYAEQRENYFLAVLSVAEELGERTANFHVPADLQKTLMNDDVVDIDDLVYQNENDAHCCQNVAYQMASEKKNGNCDLLMKNVEDDVHSNGGWNMVWRVTCIVPWVHSGDILPRIRRRVAMKDDDQNGLGNRWGWDCHVAEADMKEPNEWGLHKHNIFHEKAALNVQNEKQVKQTHH